MATYTHHSRKTQRWPNNTNKSAHIPQTINHSRRKIWTRLGKHGHHVERSHSVPHTLVSFYLLFFHICNTVHITLRNNQSVIGIINLVYPNPSPNDLFNTWPWPLTFTRQRFYPQILYVMCSAEPSITHDSITVFVLCVYLSTKYSTPGKDTILYYHVFRAYFGTG